MSYPTKVQSHPKKKSLHATQAESVRVQALRVKYWQQIRDVSPENLIFIDETGVNLTMVRTHGRALAGKRAYGERPYHHRDNITLIGAIGDFQGINYSEKIIS